MLARGLGFVGRARELAELGALLEDALAGLGRLAVIRGEAGIGKTRLASELAARAEEAGAVVLVGRAWEEGSAPSGWPFVEALRAAREAPRLEGAKAAIDDALEALRAPGAAGERFAALDRVARGLATAAEEAPLLVVLDDLHWADATTLVLLKLVVRQLARARALVLITYREVEARLAPEPLRLLTDLGREGCVIALPPLDEREVAALVERAGVAAAHAPRVHRRAGGNPFFVEQLVRWMPAGGEGDEPPLTDGARSMIARRLSALSEGARSLIEHAAAIGSEIDPGLLRDALGDPGDEDLSAALAHGVLTTSGERLRFSHDLVREAVLAACADRAAAHRAVAAALERRGGEPGEVARHLLVCGDPRAVDLAVEGARRAERRGDDEEAASLLEGALSRLRRRGEAPDRAEVELAIARGEALLRAGHIERGSAQCLEAAALARRISAPDLSARAALAYGSVVRFGRVDPHLVALLEEALEATEDPRVRATLGARLAAAMQPAARPEAPLERAREAIAAARASGDVALLARVLDLARPAFRALDGVEERAAIDRETLTLAESLGDHALALRAEQRLAAVLLEAGDVAASDHHHARAARAGRAQHPSSRIIGAMIHTSRALLAGDFDAAEQRMRVTAELYRSMPDPEAVVGMNPLPMMRLLLLRGRRRAEDRRELEALELPASPVRDVLLAVVGAHLGDRAGAEAALGALMARGDHVRLNYLPAAVLPEVVATLGDAARAAELLDVVRQLDGRNVVQFGGICEGAGARLLGLLHATMGRNEDAEACYEQALRMNEAMGAAPFVPATKLAQAELLLRRDGRSERSRRLLAEAMEGFGALGMTASLERARALDGGGDGRAPIEARPPSLAALRREGEVWTLEHAGAAHRLKDSHGLRYLAHLLERPGVEVHVEDLSLTIPRPAGAEPDAGPLLDAKAKEAYRQRLADLRDQLEEAEVFGDLGRAAAARAEMELLAGELARAVGLGGRDRRASSRAERARVNVTLRIRKAIRKIAELCPAAGDHLERNVRTGAFCAYDPPPGAGRVTT